MTQAKPVNPGKEVARKQKLSPSDLDIHYEPLPGSTKEYHEGQIFSDIRVPFRRVHLSDTQIDGRTEANAPVDLYDCSGPYTDKEHVINIEKGLPETRRKWVMDRGDVEELDGFSSAFYHTRRLDEKLDAIRFPNKGKPLRAKSGQNV